MEPRQSEMGFSITTGLRVLRHNSMSALLPPIATLAKLSKLTTGDQRLQWETYWHGINLQALRNTTLNESGKERRREILRSPRRALCHASEPGIPLHWQRLGQECLPE